MSSPLSSSQESTTQCDQSSHTLNTKSRLVFEPLPPAIGAYRRVCAVTGQGIEVIFEIRQINRGRPLVTAIFKEATAWSLFGVDGTPGAADVSDYRSWLTGIFDLIWEKTICQGCHIHYAESAVQKRDAIYCYECSLKPKAAGVNCVICFDEVKVVGKLCTCHQFVCVGCWHQYRQRTVCPHCRVPYPSLKRRYEER